ncbi:unnamed protein product [[Candida] boidinii]|nr:unnamed protein product [[Candida] boidinii]
MLQIRTEGVKIEEFDLSENPYDFINSTDDFQVKLKHDYSVNNSTTDLYKSAEEANHKRVSGNHDGSSDLGNEGDMVNEKAPPSTPSTNNNTSEINSTAATGTNGNGTPSSTRRLSRTGAFGSQVNSATASITGNIHRTLRRVASAPLGLKSLTEGSDSNDFSSQPVIQESSDNDPKSAINSNGLLTSDKSSNGSSKTDDLKSHIGEISVRHRSSSKPTGRNYAGNSARVSTVEVSPQSFEKLKLLGKGDVGKVYLVREKATKKLYAMKILNKKEMIERNKIKRVLAEQEILATSNHPFIVTFSTNKENEMYSRI